MTMISLPEWIEPPLHCHLDGRLGGNKSEHDAGQDEDKDENLGKAVSTKADDFFSCRKQALIGKGAKKEKKKTNKC